MTAKPGAAATMAEWRVFLPDGHLAAEFRAESMMGDAFISSYVPTTTGLHTFLGRFDGTGDWVPLTTKVIDAVELGEPDIAVERNSGNRNLRVVYPVLVDGMRANADATRELVALVTVSKVTSLRPPLSNRVTVGDKCGVARALNRPDGVEYRQFADTEEVATWYSSGEPDHMLGSGAAKESVFPGRCLLTVEGPAGLYRGDGPCNSVGWSNQVSNEEYSALDHEVYVVESCILPYDKLRAAVSAKDQMANCSDRRWLAVSGVSGWLTPCF
jgi:hypothetical protein